MLSNASAMSDASATISPRHLNVLSAFFIAFSIPSIHLLISCAVCCDASVVLAARFPTSSATTAKPFPLSPALAASTSALSASILVWNAIDSIVPTIFWISADISFTLLTTSTRSVISLLPLLIRFSKLLSFSFTVSSFSEFF